MNLLWAATIIGNLLLLAVLLWYRAWRQWPIFFTTQVIGVLFGALCLWTFYDVRHITDHQHHVTWLITDQLCILLNAAAAWELSGKYCWKRSPCLMALLLYLDAVAILSNYAFVYSDSVYIHTANLARGQFDCLIIFALSGIAWLHLHKERQMTKKKPVKIKPMTTTGAPGTRPGQPPPTLPPTGNK